VASSFIQIIPQGDIGGITVDATLDEVHLDRLEVTEHPVESGTTVSDHSFTRPAEVILRCGWSNSNPSALLDVATSLFFGGSLTISDYVSSVYSRLLALQDSRTLFSITTSLRQYDNMLVTALQVTRDQKTSQALLLTAHCREVIVVSTQSTSLPPQSSQANPPGTAQTQDIGTATVAPASPTPGGALPPSNWSGPR
jgi:hypothetical protein